MPDKQRREIRSQHIFTEKFTEGEWHIFKVLKTLSIPGDEIYFLLESRLGNRLLMPAGFYKAYGIEPGKHINCHIDKINCSGKIFLEPENPYYKTGVLYKFRVEHKEEFTDRKGRKQQHFLVTGPGNIQSKAIIASDFDPNLPVYIYAKFIRARKGLLILNEIEVVNNCL